LYWELHEYRIYLDLKNIYEDLRKAVGDDPMPFTFDELLNWAGPLVMVVDHRNKTPETMEVLQNEWKAYCLVKMAHYHRAIDIKRLKRKLEMLTVASDDTTVQKIELEMDIAMLESETLEKRIQRKEEEEEDPTTAAAAAVRKEEARQRKEGVEEEEKKKEARQRKDEAWQRKEEEEERKKEEVRRRKEEARRRKEEQEEQEKQAQQKVRQRKKQQEEQTRQRKKEQEEQAPKARGKYKDIRRSNGGPEAV